MSNDKLTKQQTWKYKIHRISGEKDKGERERERERRERERERERVANSLEEEEPERTERISVTRVR